MIQKSDPLRAYYAARAAEYDRVYLKPERQADLRQIEAWLPAHFAGRRVLEVACGTGYWTRLIAPVATHMLALDAAPEALEIARRRMPEERVLLKVGDAYALHECIKPGQRFDAAFAGFWWSHVPRARLREFLQGLHACLEPCARVVFLDNRFATTSRPAAARLSARRVPGRHLAAASPRRRVHPDGQAAAMLTPTIIMIMGVHSDHRSHGCLAASEPGGHAQPRAVPP